MRKFCVIVMAFVLPFSVLGQNKNLKDGYIITLSQDTIFGKVHKQNSDKIICKFQNSEGKVIDYQPNDIFAFGYTKGKIYASKRLNEKDFFVEYLVKGNLNLYHFKDGKNDRYFVDNQLDSLAEIRLVYETIQGTSGMNLWKLSNQHIELLNKFTAEAPSLKHKISKINHLEDENLIEIVEKYNKIICGQKKCKCCEVFKTDIYKYGFEINPIFGFNAFVTKDLTFTGGLIAYYRLPKCDNKLFVKAGLLYSKITQPQLITKQNGFIQFPVQIEARYPTKYFRPKVAIGLNLTSLKYFHQFYHTMFSFGADINITKKIYFSLNYDLNFEPLFLILPLRVSSHSLLFGANFVF